MSEIIAMISHEKSDVELVEEAKERILYIMMFQLRAKFDGEKFVEEMSKQLNKTYDENDYTVFLDFLKLDGEVQADIIRECTEHFANSPLLTTTCNFELFEPSGNYQGNLTKVEIRRRIKYAKNPMEKMMLEKDLGDSTFAKGKHRYGKKHKR